MKKVILFCLLITANIFAQSTWNTIYYRDSVLNAIYFINNTTGWAGGDYGKIIKTTDGGIHWESRNLVPPYIYNVVSLRFINENTGWAGINYGPILKTIDGGITWTPYNLDNNYGSSDEIFFINNNTGWTIKSEWYYRTRVFKTTDCGASWFLQYSSGGFTGFTEFKSIKFYDSNTGWMCGINGQIAKTTNGGSEWFSQNSNTIYHLQKIFFTNANTGWTAGAWGTICKTTNSGNNWIPGGGYLPVTLNDWYFSSGLNGWGVGQGGYIIRTTNGGTNWFNETSGYFGTPTTLNGVFFPSNDTGYIVGFNSSNKGIILKTTDDNYNPPAEPDAPTNLEAVADSSKRINLVWQDNSINEDGFKIERSTDGGNNWSLLNTVGQNTTLYADTGLIPYSIYFYRIYAYNTSGNSVYSNIAWDTAKSYKSCDNIVVLITKINVLKNTNVLNQGQANALIVKLNSVCEHSGRGNFNAAINQIGAFINQVNAFMNANILTQAQGQPLIAIANDVIHDLELGHSPLLKQEEQNNIPKVTKLFDNYPNPFNPSTVISYSVGIPTAQLVVSSFTSLKIYDVLGHEIATLVNEQLKPGKYEVEFNGTNYPSGVYFYNLTTQDFSETKKFILIK